MTVYEIPLRIIADNPWQTRQSIDPAYVAELAEDIKRNDLMQPPAGRVLFVTAVETRVLSVDDVAKLHMDGSLYTDPAIVVQLAMGHNRRAAYVLLAEPDPERYGRLPMQIGYYDDQAMAKMAWSENAQRKDLTPWEEAKAIHKAMQDFGWSQAAAGEHFGLNRATIANKLRLLQLPDEIGQQLHAGAISERQASAMVPLYTLPEPARKALDKPDNSWVMTPKEIEERAAGGSSSDNLRAYVEKALNSALREFNNDIFPPATQIGEGHPDVRHGTCTDCELKVKRDGKEFCGDAACFDHKRISWLGHVLASAQRISGLPDLDRKISLWQCEDFGYGDEAAGQAIVAEGCKHGRLRQYYDPTSKNGVRVKGVPQVRIVCQRDGRACHCLKAKQRANATEDPEVQAEKAAKKRLDAELVKPALTAVTEALTEMEPEAWRAVLKAISYSIDHNTLDGDWDKLISRLARKVIDAALPYRAWEYMDKSSEAIIQLLADLGRGDVLRDLPLGDLTADARRRFERVQSWIERGDFSNPEAVRGNITNLERIQEELDALPNEAVAELFYGEVGLALERLRALAEEVPMT